MDRKEYSQLRLKERIEIYRLHAGGKSARYIARYLGRSASTVSRELARNGRKSHAWPEGGYHPERAQALYLRRHARGRAHKLERQPELRKQVLDQLAMDRSPEQIAGRLALEQGKPVISHESIYRYIYWRAYVFRGEALHRLLPLKRRSRRRRGSRRGGQPPFPNRVAARFRPKGALNRSRYGHWEADLMHFSEGPEAILVLSDRRSRYVCLRRQASKKAAEIAGGLHALLASLPGNRRRTVTFDNGQEFRHHELLASRHHIKTFFCDAHAPWQKGGVENAIKRLRRFLPRRTDPATVCQSDLDKLMLRINNTPRKCLGFKTPAEAFFNQTVALQT